MSVEDKQLARLLLRELHKRQSLDTTEARVSASRGIGYIGGIIRPSSGMFIDPKEEIKGITDVCRKIPGLRDLVIDAKFDLGYKK